MAALYLQASAWGALVRGWLSVPGCGGSADADDACFACVGLTLMMRAGGLLLAVLHS